MVGRNRLLPWERFEGWDDWIEGSGSCKAPNRDDCSQAITNNIWRAYAGTQYHPRTTTNAASDLSTGKSSNEAGFGETSGRRSHSISDAQSGARFITDGDWEASSTCKHLPLPIASLANYHIEMWFGRRHCDGSRITGGVDTQIGKFDDVFRVNAIGEPILLRVSFCRFSMTKLCDRIIRQYVSKGHMGHANILDSKSSWLTNNELYLGLPVTVEW